MPSAETGRRNLTKRRIVTTPADPGEIKIQCGSSLFLVTDRPHRATARIRAAQHQVADPFGVAGRVGHRDSAALRHPEQREAFQPKRFHHGLQVGNLVVECEIRCFPVR